MCVDIDLIRLYISYDPESGLFSRIKLAKNDSVSELGPITSLDNGGYVIFSVLGVSYLAHRLAFLFMGEDIPKLVDHKNRVRSDNRWVNLQAADKFINAQNRGLQKNNVSGCAGIIYDKHRRKFRTYTRFNGKSYTAGRFEEFDEAVKALEDLKSNLRSQKCLS